MKKEKNCNIFAILGVFIMAVVLAYVGFLCLSLVVDSRIRAHERLAEFDKDVYDITNNANWRNGPSRDLRMYIDGKTYYITNGVMPETILLKNHPIMFE